MIWLARLARLAALALRGLSLPFLALGWLATPILWCARVCQDKAREWDPDLWAHGGHTDLHPPPGA